MKYYPVLFIFLFTTQFIPAKVWEVPGDCPTIQAGLDSCQTGDTVLVAPGTYYENLTWPSTHSICLMSDSGADVTTIDGTGVNRVIKLDTGVDTTTIVTGFTITNGYDELGAGIRCINNSSPTITQNIITQNIAFGPTYGLGGGIGVFSNSSPIIKENSITYNSADSVGGGIACSDNSNPHILNNIIKYNEADFGGGIHCYVNSNPEIIGNTIDSNKAFISGGGIRCRFSSSPVIKYNDIFDNEGYGVINVDSTVIVNAEHNWWGDASGPSGAGPGLGDSVSLYVDFDPWLVNPILEVNEEKINEIPIYYTLSQNYPNPFNPTTTIKYSIHKLSFIAIKVYDVLGNEIATLVNEEKQSGSYKVEFNASNLPSGIYFYQLSAGSFVETKKMVLMK